MQFFQFVLAAAAATGAVAASFSNTTTTTTTATQYTTQTVTAYETYCPKKTTFTQGTSTYTGHKKQWVTVPCPSTCAITNAVGVKPTVVPFGTPKYANSTVSASTTPCPCATVSVSRNGTTSAAASSCPCLSTSTAVSGVASSTGSVNGASTSSSSSGNTNGVVQANEGGKNYAGNAMAALAVVGAAAAALL